MSMKKNIITILSVIVFLGCCFIGINAYAADGIDISDASISLSKYEYTYNTKEHNPTPTVKLDDNKLIRNTDYTVEYKNNINAGTGTVTINGIGEYSGVKEISFTVKPRNITSTNISRNQQKVYVNQKPTYTVVYDSKRLRSNKDYIVSVSKNNKVGIKSATVTITGKGNYCGKKSYKLTIRPARVRGVGTESRTDTSVSLSWDSQKQTGISGYKVYSCDKNGENRTFLLKTGDNKAEIANLKTGKVNYFVIRSYYVDGDTVLHGNYSKVKKTCTKPEKIQISSVSKNSAKDKLVVKWEKTRCSGYVIQYTTDKDFKKNIKKVYVKNPDATSKKIKIKKNDKTYYVRIKAYRDYTINSNKYRLYGKSSRKLSSNYNVLYVSFSTYHASSAGRQANLRTAAKYINGTILKPGEVFSFDAVVGPRTSARGFRQAPVFTGAKGSAMGIGGGVCQVATTIFNAALKANLGIVERHQHSQKVSYVPYGRDAAISGGSKNFRFKNTTNYPIKIVMSASGGSVYCKFYVSTDVKHKKTDIRVSRNGNHYTLKRYVDGNCNYTAYSTY